MFEGATLGERYQVFGQIGGSSLVVRYDGVDALLARPVDIVTLTARAMSDPDLRDQFGALGRAAASRSHPHIIDVYDLGTHDGRPYIVTEHLTGEPLAAIIADEAPFHPDDAVALIQQLAGPADNEATRSTGGEMVSVETVVVDASGVAKHSDLLTFGARHTAAEDEWTGRPHAPLPPAAPVPALAAITYELMTARPPEDGPRSSRPSASNAAVTPDIDRIVMRALDPRLRDYPSAAAFANALTAAASRARQIRATAPGPARAVPPPIPPARREPEAAPTLVTPSQATATRGAMPPPTLVSGDEDESDAPFGPSRPRGVPWSWVAIGVLGALVLALGLARLRDMNSSSPATPTPSGQANDVPVVLQHTTEPPAETVPAVTGMTRDAAANELANAGLILREDAPAFSDTVPAGSVVTQQPAAGAGIPDGRTVAVTLSRGPETVNLAALGLIGKSNDDARQMLTSKGFTVQTREDSSQTVPAGKVIALEPDGAATPGTAVTLVLSVGDKLQIPRDIFSMPVQQAEQRLAQSGISVARTIAVGPAAVQGKLDTAQYQIASGDVIGVQDEAGDANFGAWIRRDSAVTLVYYDASS